MYVNFVHEIIDCETLFGSNSDESSTDSSGEVCSKHKENYIHIIIYIMIIKNISE